ncbi:von Willebrand factor A domain-containing protein 7-like [Polyodon spathula]|uniref:von Willebrand factor A domain-containing protein 7-like n=1 Tax=Polyodon spathula TaxID=7913 RepID=UPI001B7ECC21|nr:von Willebrand factor A domain-containing protein 7-like [Polyodon spathula]
MHLLLLLFLHLLGRASSFYPNHESKGVGLQDLTDADITEMGILKAVATFMERNPSSGTPEFRAGELVNLSPLTPTTLFQAYFRAEVSPSRFIKAIQQIVVGNNEVEIYQKDDSSYHFNCEEISKGILNFQRIRDSVLSGSVNMSSLESARLNTGRALHILQKFYSNTNWVELGQNTPYHHLVNSTVLAYPVAPSTIPTCKDCSINNSGFFDCTGNILVKNLLTSGYKTSTNCRIKPKGKCGHGGLYDETQFDPPTGGINKETSNPKLSPHHYLHHMAAGLAINATKEYFIGEGFGLLNLLGPDLFRKFFNLEGYSLTFVIDVTGSMGNDIAQVKTTCIDLIKKHANSLDAPYNYILVPFNDPEYGPVYKTQNVAQFQNNIASLTVGGGGDCPEMAMSGLELALTNSEPRSKIFLFTDAGAKDISKLDDILLLVESTKSQIYPFLTGYCAPEGTILTTQNEYDIVADLSGTDVISVQKSNLYTVLGVLELALNSAPVWILHTVLLTDRLQFLVDETLKEISISVRTSTPFTLNVFLASGLQANTTEVVSRDNFKIVKIIVKEPGSWNVVLSKIQMYTFEIDGKSLLDFSYQIMEEHNGYVLPIQGRPTKGSNYTLSVDVQGSVSNMTVTKILLLNNNGEVNTSINVNQMTDSNGRLKVVVSVQLQLTFLLIGITGKTDNGNEFKRVNPDLIRTEDVQLIFPPGQQSTLIGNGTLNITVLVVNKGKERSQFKLQVKDEFSLLTEFHPSSVTLDAGETMNLSATFHAPTNSNYSSSIATFTARSESAKNYLNILITVVPKSTLVTDDTPPQYEIESMNMPCKDTWQLMDECKRHQWNLIFRAWDESSQVYVSVGSEIPETQELICKEPVGAGSIPWVSCQYSSSCCYPYVDIIIQDKAGNANVLRVDNRQPMTENQNSNIVKVAVSCATVIFVVCLSLVVCFLIFWRRRKRRSQGIYRID